MKCGVLKSNLADAGQGKEDKPLRGWLDIDEFWGGGAAPAISADGGVNGKVFVGGEAAAKTAAAGGVLATQ